MVNVYINYEKKFAFVEFRTGEPTHDAKSCRILLCSLDKESIKSALALSASAHLQHICSHALV